MFGGWTGSNVVEFANANNSTTTFVMLPGYGCDVTVTANYVDTYAVTVVNGTADKARALAGETVTITANTPPENHVFGGWTGSNGVEFANANNSTTTFVMPANDVTVSASYITAGGGGGPIVGPVVGPVVGGDKYSVTVVDGIANPTSAAAGDTVSITANIYAWCTFIEWTGDDGVVFANANARMTQFTMPAKNVTVTATYKPKTKYAVTVVNGTANPTSAAEGETVTITANEPAADQEFDGWTTEDGVNFANANDVQTSFAMPAKNVSVTATYKAKTVAPPPTTKYTVTVVNGTANPTTAAEGATVTITADEPAADQEFDVWTTDDGVNFANANDVQTSFTMPAKNVSVTATYKAKTVAPPTPTKYTVTVVYGRADKTEAAAGDTVTITADEPADDEEFDYWSGNVDFYDESQSRTTFVMPARAVTVTANYFMLEIDDPSDLYFITVENGSADKTMATPGEAVTITADEPANGERFAGWAGEGVDFEDANAAVTMFLMPEDDVTVTATYVDTYAVTVVNGTANMAEAAEDDTVTIIADEPAADEEFDKWVGDGVTFADATAEETSFVMPANAVRVTATYKSKAPQKFTVTVENGVADKATAAKGEIVTITADDRFPSHKLLRWTTATSGVKFADKLSAETTFVMPAKDVTVKATYQVLPRYTVKVTNGTADKAQAYAGETVTVTAAEPPSGKQFYKWTCTGLTFEDANVVQTTFVMPKKSVWVKANYTAAP